MADDQTLDEEGRRLLAEEAGKRLAWEMMGCHLHHGNLSAYARHVIRSTKGDCDLLRVRPSKELRVRYGLPSGTGYIDFVWWLLEQVEKGNIKIDYDALSEP